MLRVCYVEMEGRKQTAYETLFCIGQETPVQILEKHSLNPETRSVFINGNYIPKHKMEQPLCKLTKQGNIFLTVQLRQW